MFLDLKLHDIPTTVRKSARVAGALGASYLTLHARAGAVMLRAGVDGLREGAAAGGLPEPTALAVTILTSDADAPAHILGGRVAAAVESGCGGVIVAAADVHEAKQLAPRLLAVVPGIRLPTRRPPRPGPGRHPPRRVPGGRRHARDRPGRHRGRRPPAAAAALHAAIVGGGGGS